VGSYAKMETQFCGPFEILERVGPTTYMLTFPPTVKEHDVFHVFLHEKYRHDVNHIVD